MNRRPSGGGQLILFPGATAGAVAASPGRRRRPRPASRSARMAERLDALAAAAEREAAESRRAGDSMGARAAGDRASGARRAAELLRAGPAGVADVLGGRHEAA
jgi:hypothetical protein